MQRLIAWLLAKYTPFRVVAWDRGKIAGIGGPNPWLHLDSERIDQVNAQLWAQQPMGEPASSGVAQVRAEHQAMTGPDRKHGHSALRFNRETGKLESFDPHPSSKPWPLDRRTRVR